MGGKLSTEEMNRVAGGSGESEGHFLQALVDVCKYDIGVATIAALVAQSKANAKAYIIEHALPYMRKRCPGYSDADLQNRINMYALQAINLVI